MSKSKAQSLSALFQRVVKSAASKKPSSASSLSPSSPVISIPEDQTLKQFVSSLDPSFPIPVSADTAESRADTASKRLSEELSSLLCGETPEILPDSGSIINQNSFKKVLDVPWFSTTSQNSLLAKRKELLRQRKQKFVQKSSQSRRFKKLIWNCARKVGTEAAFEVLSKLGRETGANDYNAMIAVYIERARESNDLEVALEEIEKAFELFKVMRERGFPVQEETYGPLLNYLTDMNMIEEFKMFSDAILEGNPALLPRIGYYEMLLWITVDEENKIQELCSSVCTGSKQQYSALQENYLVALCERDRKEDLLRVLESTDITQISSRSHLTSIFKAFGRLLLEPIAAKLLMDLKRSDYKAENVSDLIFHYATSIQNIGVEDVISKIEKLHEKMEIMPSYKVYEQLILYACGLLKVHVALDIVEQILEGGETLSTDILHAMLRASELSYEFNLVRRIYSLICHHQLKPNLETFRSMISLSVKMKDFKGAYEMLNGLKQMNLTPTASIYNAIMSGYFREKNTKGALRILKQMQLAGIKPDSLTFGLLINNCNREEDITKYYKELTYAGVQVSKQIYMSLINAYANCGQLERAKQVVLDKGIPVKNLNEIKCALITVLASNGKTSDAFDMYHEIKQAECTVEPKAIISLIEYFPPSGEVSTLFQLLEDLHHPDYWIDGCCRVLLFCVLNKHLDFAFDLMKKLKNKVPEDDESVEHIFDEIFSAIAETEPPDLQVGLELLKFIRNELSLPPSRKYLDFLLSACVTAKDLRVAQMIWEEYEMAGLSYNVMSLLRMYQVLLVSGNWKGAKSFLSSIPKDDPHIRCVIQELRSRYRRAKRKKKNEKSGGGKRELPQVKQKVISYRNASVIQHEQQQLG